jgi:predicted metal-binding membrane protein
MWPTLDDRRPFLVLATSLVALMWLSLWLWGQSPYGRFLSHEELGHVDGVAGGYATLVLLFVGGWTLMTVAMMLPTSLPLVALFYSFVRTRPGRVRLTALLVLGYLGVWTFFGFLVHAGDGVVHQVVERSARLEANAWVIGAGTVLLAGAYQFSPLKYRCLEKCRSPLSFVLGHWHGGRRESEAFRLGVHHGLYCLGCCWSLMLLMFAVGVGNLGWMLALGAVMAVEKNVSWGRRLSAPLGVLLLGWGVVLVATQTSIASGA